MLPLAMLDEAIEYVPTWVVGGVALALGIGTTIGYKRIVVTVAEKIGKSHMTYAQGVAAEFVAAVTIGLADVFHMPVSTTHVLSSGVAGTMWANSSGIQGETVRKIGLAWVLTLPAAILLSASLFSVGGFLIPAARLHAVAAFRKTVPWNASVGSWVSGGAVLNTGFRDQRNKTTNLA
jgi:phosphate/sulfate permease